MSAPAFDAVRVGVAGPVGRLTLHRPDRLNAIDEAMVAEITAAAAWFDTQPAVAAVVLDGAGRMFSAGADLVEFRDRFPDLGTERGHAASLAQARLGGAMTDAVAGMRAVTVAAVHGAAVGGAVALLAACDLRVVADDVAVRVPELAMGVPLAWGGIPRLVRELGPALTRNLLLTGRAFTAEEAVATGWATSRHPLGEFVAAAVDLAHHVAALPAAAVRVALRRVQAAATGGTLDDDAEALADAAQDPAAIEAVTGYLAALDVRRSSSGASS